MLAFHDIAAGKVSGLRVQVGKNILEAYRYLVENPDWDESTFPDSIDGRSARPLKKIYMYLKEQVTQAVRNESDLTTLLKKVLGLAFFLVVEVEEELQAFDVFERTNARGSPLNVADLLKNRLFAESALIPSLSERWDAIITSSESMLPRILKYYDALRNGHNTSRKILFPHLKKQVEDLGPDVFMDEIETFSKFFNAAVDYRFTRDESNWISTDDAYNFLYSDEIFFKRVKRSLDALTLFSVFVPIPAIYAGLNALKQFADEEKYPELKSEYIKTLNLIECYHFINNGVGTRATNTAEQLYAATAKAIFDAKTLSKCKEHLKSLQSGLKEIGLVEEADFSGAFLDLSYSKGADKPLIVYIFDRFNQGPFSKTPSLTIFDPQSKALINRTYEVEHISPIATWEGDEDGLNNIGNLLVLTMETNRLAGHLDLTEKIALYKNRSCDSLSPVKDFVTWIEAEKIRNITPDTISKRTRLLAETAYRETWKPF